MANLTGSNVTGTNNPDTIGGTSGNDILFGRSGSDFIVGRGGNDFILGGGGRDTLNGNAGNDVIKGGTGRDSLFGGRGDDILFGGAGADRLRGDFGADDLYGGSGNDLFYFDAATAGRVDQLGGLAHDRIMDFEVGDTVRFGDYGPQTLLGFVQSGGNVEIHVDVDGDGTNDYLAAIVQNAALSDVMAATSFGAW